MKMFISHQDGADTKGPAAERSMVGYLFEDAATLPDTVLPTSHATVNALLDLGAAMGDPGTRADAESSTEGSLPAVMSDFARFIAHDLTVRVDWNKGVTPVPGCARDIGHGSDLAPMPPGKLVRCSSNARRPQFDLACLYGDGPSLSAGPGCAGRIGATSDQLYDGPRLKVRFDREGRLDLPRHAEGACAGQAIIGDARNDLSLTLSQFHAAWLRFNNVVFESTHGGSTHARWTQTRRLVRWTYQYLVVNEFLAEICDAEVLKDVAANGPRFFRPDAEAGSLALPLEFALAAMPVADATVRPFYTINEGLTLSLDEIRIPSERFIGADHRLTSEAVVAWRHFVDLSAEGLGQPQRARPIGPRLTLGFGGRTEAARAITGQAQRQLIRGYLTSLPTGQAVATCMGITPMDAEQLRGDDPVLAHAISIGGFAGRTPLWYYLLREAEVLGHGLTLGPVGSRLVAETVVGLLKADAGSYLNHAGNRAVTSRGIEIASGFNAATIGSLADLVRYAGLRR